MNYLNNLLVTLIYLEKDELWHLMEVKTMLKTLNITSIKINFYSNFYAEIIINSIK